MPFQSESQRRYLFANEPEVAKRWAHEYETPKDLPYHKGDKKKRKRQVVHAEHQLSHKYA